MCLLVLGAGLASAGAGRCRRQRITFPNGNLTFSPNDVIIKTGDTATLGTSGATFAVTSARVGRPRAGRHRDGHVRDVQLHDPAIHPYYCRIHQSLAT